MIQGGTAPADWRPLPLVAVAVGWDNGLALQADGTVVAWGRGSATNFPSGLTNVVAVSAGFAHSVALIGDGTPMVHASLTYPAWSSNLFRVSLPTQSGRVYALAYKNSLEDATWIVGFVYAFLLRHNRLALKYLASEYSRFVGSRPASVDLPCGTKQHTFHST